VAAAAWAPYVATTVSSMLFHILSQSNIAMLREMASYAQTNPKKWYYKLKPFAGIPRIIMTAWFFEEVAETIWMWYATLSGIFE